MKYAALSFLVFFLNCLPLAGIEFIESRYFITVAKDFESATAVKPILEEMEQVGKDYLKVPSSFKRKVEIQLVDAATVGTGEAYSLYENGDDGVGVAIAWNKNTRIEDAADAIARAYIRHLAMTRHGLQASRRVPEWLQFALSYELQTRVRPAFITYLANEAEKVQLQGLIDIFTAKAPFGTLRDDIAISSYWLLRYMQDQLDNDDALAQFLTLTLAGRSELEMLVNGLKGRFLNPRQMELWWATGFYDQINQRSTPYDTLTESQERLLDRAFVTVEVDAQDLRLTGQRLWENRAMEPVQRAVIFRLQQLTVELKRVNPAFYNAQNALMKTYEALLSNEENRYKAASQKFLKAFDTASYLSREVEKALAQ